MTRGLRRFHSLVCSSDAFASFEMFRRRAGLSGWKSDTLSRQRAKITSDVPRCVSRRRTQRTAKSEDLWSFDLNDCSQLLYVCVKKKHSEFGKSTSLREQFWSLENWSLVRVSQLWFTFAESKSWRGGEKGMRSFTSECWEPFNGSAQTFSGPALMQYSLSTKQSTTSQFTAV